MPNPSGNNLPAIGTISNPSKVQVAFVRGGNFLAGPPLSVVADAALTAATDASGYGFVVDEDDMASDSATKLPTQQSVKAYTDARTTVATQAQAEDGTDNITVLTPLRLTQKLKYNGWLSARDLGIRLDGTIESNAINLQLEDKDFPVFFPPAVIPMDEPLTAKPGGGVFGLNEYTIFERQFSGGAMLQYDGQGLGDVGQQPWFRSFSITTAAGQTVVEGDDGLTVGLLSGWGGRGAFDDILIKGQWDGFVEQGGTDTTYKAIRCVENENHGFNLINPRGTFLGCLAQYNRGSAYRVYAATAGETGVVFIMCGTFANQGFGLLLDAAAGVTGANFWIDGKFSSSFDGQGGVYVGTAYTQLDLGTLFIEQAGYANTLAQASDFTDYPGAKGLTILGGTRVTLNRGMIINNRGGGVLIDGAEVNWSGRPTIGNNGLGLGTGADRVGFSVQNAAKVWVPEGINFEAYKGSTSQTTDFAVNTSDCFAEIGNSDMRTVFDTGGTTRYTGQYPGLDQATLATASVPAVKGYHRLITFTGTTTIDALPVTWRGHRYKGYFTGACPIGGGNNLKGGGFTTVAGSVHDFYCDGTNVYVS